ncbi:hypothetical protein [Lentilactobacillus farraginis]|uniref:Acyltransferase n=1 Tax=Lentilactobacillus farraginis DSM 18382 = JCM 14108 TaxID=1423743 RepID=X0PBG1_9LACO|nr:hypothetical protein [Lentilactobacillus farraginis]GAF37414.1 acyltransferase [Lentilactobacillus farraginis DSM 18382 = JCM 14108]
MAKTRGQFIKYSLLGFAIFSIIMGLAFWKIGNAQTYQAVHRQRFITSKASKIHLTSREKRVAKKYRLNRIQTRTATKISLTAIGDSVMVDVKPNLKQVFPTVPSAVQSAGNSIPCPKSSDN